MSSKSAPNEKPKDEKPFMRAVMGLDKEAVHLDMRDREELKEPKVIPIGLTIDGRTFRGEIVVESFGGTISPEYRCYFRADALTANLVEDAPPLRAHPTLGPDYVVGSDGFPILRSAVTP